MVFSKRKITNDGGINVMTPLGDCFATLGNDF